MMTRTTEWLNANRYRRYPFRDGTSLTCKTGQVLANDVLLDCQLTSRILARFPFVLLTVQVITDAILFCFGYDTVMCYAAIPVAATYPFTVTGISGGLRYSLVFGPGCDTIQNFAHGTYELVTPPEIQPAIVIVQDRHHIDSVTAKGTDQDTLTGLIYVEPGYNCNPVITTDKIHLSAGLGFGAGRYCVRLDGADVSCAEALLWWNGQNASEDGNIIIKGGAGVTVESRPDENLVVIRGSKALENLKCG